MQFFTAWWEISPRNRTHWMTSKLKAPVFAHRWSENHQNPDCSSFYYNWLRPRKGTLASWWQQVAEPASPAYSVDLTMKFWRLMGFMTTGGPAVRGQAWNLVSVACHHSFSETVLGVEPVCPQRMKQLKSKSTRIETQISNINPVGMTLTSKSLLVRNKCVTQVCNGKGSDQWANNVASCHFCCKRMDWGTNY